MLNVKSRNMDLRKRQPLQAVISDPNDFRLDYLLEFGEMCLKMGGRQGKREKQLSKDTAACIHHTCCGIVDLAKHLLIDEVYDYVCLGEFTTDPLEKAFSKFRQGSGGAYFINVRQVSEKFRIQKAKLQLTLNSELISSSRPSTHRCDNCEYVLNNEESEMFDQLPLLESDISKETMSNIVHIAGYVCRKSLSEDEDETYHYYEKYGKFTNSLSRGGLTVPGDKACQWAAMSYLMFGSLKHKVCRTSLTRIFQNISNFHALMIDGLQARMLANTLLSIFCKNITPRQQKETKQKVLKLS